MSPNLSSGKAWTKAASSVVSIGHSLAFYVIFVPLEYILSMPPYSTYVKVFSYWEKSKDFYEGTDVLRHNLYFYPVEQKWHENPENDQWRLLHPSIIYTISCLMDFLFMCLRSAGCLGNWMGCRWSRTCLPTAAGRGASASDLRMNNKPKLNL